MQRHKSQLLNQDYKIAFSHNFKSALLLFTKLYAFRDKPILCYCLPNLYAFRGKPIVNDSGEDAQHCVSNYGIQRGTQSTVKLSHIFMLRSKGNRQLFSNVASIIYLYALVQASALDIREFNGFHLLGGHPE